MKRPSREEYERAVALAENAIRECMAATKAGPTQPDVVAATRKFEAGSELTAKERRMLAEALNGAMGGAKRRGRPPGSGEAKEEAIAVLCALLAVRNVPIQLYHDKYASHTYSRCNAVAEAMRNCGQMQICTYDAVEGRAKKAKAALKKLRQEFATGVVALQAGAENLRKGIVGIQQGFANLQRAFADMPNRYSAAIRDNDHDQKNDNKSER